MNWILNITSSTPVDRDPKIINKPVLLKSDLQLISGIDCFLERAFTADNCTKKTEAACFGFNRLILLERVTRVVNCAWLSILNAFRSKVDCFADLVIGVLV